MSGLTEKCAERMKAVLMSGGEPDAAAIPFVDASPFTGVACSSASAHSPFGNRATSSPAHHQKESRFMASSAASGRRDVAAAVNLTSSNLQDVSPSPATPGLMTRASHGSPLEAGARLSFEGAQRAAATMCSPLSSPASSPTRMGVNAFSNGLQAQRPAVGALMRGHTACRGFSSSAMSQFGSPVALNVDGARLPTVGGGIGMRQMVQPRARSQTATASSPFGNRGITPQFASRHLAIGGGAQAGSRPGTLRNSVY